MVRAATPVTPGVIAASDAGLRDRVGVVRHWQALALWAWPRLCRFRDGQEEAIRHVYQGDGRFFGGAENGLGKSFVHFIDQAAAGDRNGTGAARKPAARAHATR